MGRQLALIALGSLFLLAGCATTDPGPCGGASCGEGMRCDPIANRCTQQLPSKCTAGTSWTPGTPIFREVTETWNEVGAAGQLISVADIDNDGYPDLFVRGSLTDGDDFNEGGKRASWLLRNEGGEGFRDVTEASGIVATRQGEGERKGRPVPLAIFADIDNDGFVDVFTGTRNPTADPSLESSEVLFNDGEGGFVLGPADSVIRRQGEKAVRMAAAFVDVDRDGWIDLLVGNGPGEGENPPQDQLYLGRGDGHFDDVTDAAGLTTLPWVQFSDLDEAKAHSNAWGAVACDVNGDGDPDLLVSSYGRAPNHLWQSIPGDTLRFENRSIESGYAFDRNQDWTDNESARCFCMLNPGAQDCAGVPPPQYIQCQPGMQLRWNHISDRNPFRLGGNSGTTVCADVNNDGHMDLLTTEIRHWDVGGSSDRSELLINDGKTRVVFDRPGNQLTGLDRAHAAAGWDEGDMTAAVFDFDNDGRLDIYIGSSDYPGTRGHLFWQRPDGTFQEVSIEDGIDHRSSHGIAVADFNRDGGLDVVVGHSRNRCGSGDHCYPTATTRFFENVLATEGNWIQLDLEGGPESNRSAIGARVSVTTHAGTQTQEVGGGHGMSGLQSDRVLHFGLGESCEAEVKIRWPDRKLTTQHFLVQTGYRYQVTQGEMPKVSPPGG